MHRSKYTILQIADIIAAEKSLKHEDDGIRYLIYDTRKINFPEQSLFFALKSNRDGHEFIKQAHNLGVRNFVIEANRVSIEAFEDANFLIVPSPLDSLQALAQHHRQQFNIPVIAITGSNGKTVVKEWLNQLLSPDFNIVRSPKSYNSQLGVALSLWQINAEHDLAIIEAGISKVGEMDRLREMIQPTVGVLTNIGPAHSEGFLNLEEKVSEKLKLFKQVEKLIYSPRYIPKSQHIPDHPALFTWDDGRDAISTPTNSVIEDSIIALDAKDSNEPEGGSAHLKKTAGLEKLDVNERTNNEHIDLNIVKKEKKGGLLNISGICRGEEIVIEIPFNDEAYIENAIICWSVLLSMDYSQEVIQKRMKALLSVEMRLELKNGINNCSIIDDSYSCDIASLVIALNFLQQQNQHKKRVLILSDIPGAANEGEAIYQNVSSLLNRNSIDRFIGIGMDIGRHSNLFATGSLFFNSTNDFIRALPTIDFRDETILLKGARAFSFEKVSKHLTLKIHDTSLEINLNALEHNLNYYKSKLDKQTKLMVMVKAFSYGSGSFEIANLLQFNHVDYLTVAYPDEGITLRIGGINLPIMVMSPDITSFETLIDNQLEPEIFTIDNLNYLIELLKARNIKDYPIHIKVETGMHRLGFETNNFDELLQILSSSKEVKVISIFSHLAASGAPEHDDFTREQISKLQVFSTSLKEVLPYQFLTHISNTAAIERWPEARFDMVRLGIGLYGVGSANERSSLETVATLKTSISQIKEVSSQDTIGYNRKGNLKNGGTIATVKIGYADGYNRRLGNGNGKMLIHGRLVPTVGDICMDMCMVDVTGLPVKAGDEVIVFGSKPRLESLAEALDTIPYEIMTGISQRVKRIYFYE